MASGKHLRQRVWCFREDSRCWSGVLKLRASKRTTCLSLVPTTSFVSAAPKARSSAKTFPGTSAVATRPFDARGSQPPTVRSHDPLKTTLCRASYFRQRTPASWAPSAAAWPPWSAPSTRATRTLPSTQPTTAVASSPANVAARQAVGCVAAATSGRSRFKS